MYFIKNILKLSDINTHLIEYIQLLKLLLRKKPFRNVSGITNITLVFPPYPNGQSFTCKHDCFYCPNEPPRKENNYNPPPRSYLTDEPAVKRGLDNDYDANKQMNTRMNELWKTGNVIDFSIFSNCCWSYLHSTT